MSKRAALRGLEEVAAEQRQTEAELVAAIADARAAGVTWAEIAGEMGKSADAARHWYTSRAAGR